MTTKTGANGVSVAVLLGVAVCVSGAWSQACLIQELHALQIPKKRKSAGTIQANVVMPLFYFANVKTEWPESPCIHH